MAQQLLKRPYPFEHSWRRTFITGLLFGMFVFAFLWYFEPFGLSFMRRGKTLAAAVFGAWCWLVLLLLDLIVPRIVPSWFDERRWNVGREILWVLLHFAVIGIGNALIAFFLGMQSLSARMLLHYEGYTIAVGIFPVVISVLVTEVRLSKRYAAGSESLNEQLHGAVTGGEAVILPSENKNEDLTLLPDQLLLLEAADNYVTVFYKKEDALQRSVLRSTLKAQEDQLAHIPAFLRVHKSYVVNCDHILRISGNAQGYKLHFDGVEHPVPVSRRRNDALRERIDLQAVRSVS